HHSASDTEQLRDASNTVFSPGITNDGFKVQSLILVTLASYARFERDRGNQALSTAIDIAHQIGLDSDAFHQDHEPLFRESWRRTWWELYTISGLISFISGTNIRLSQPVSMTLPCDTEAYDMCQVPRMGDVKEMQQRFRLEAPAQWSSFAYKIESMCILSMVLDANSKGCSSTKQSAEAAISSWLLSLPEEKQDSLQPDGEVDEVMSCALMIIHLAGICLHLPQSPLAHVGDFRTVCGNHLGQAISEYPKVHKRENALSMLFLRDSFLLLRVTRRDIVGRCIVIDDDLVQSLICACFGNTDLVLSKVTSQDLAYVIFTSGSTGDPKGIMIEHRAFASCALKFGSTLGINSDTRSLQFGSHAFGACILEIMTTLIHGGCVCIPSDDDRMSNVPAFINRSKINWMMATPSYMGTFQPEDVPGLQTLVLVGEQMSPSVNAIWGSQVRVLDGYGQSESSSICFVGSISPLGADPNNIGLAVGAHSWIIDPSDPNRLVPIGAIGELVIESPGIARDYIIPPSTEKTGDLARYASDGTVICLGRMDSQVKIRGQRFELGAVETHLRQQMPDDMSIVVEAVKPSDSPTSTVLVAFLIPSNVARTQDDPHILDYSAIKDMNVKLEQVLPRHSIPSCYIRIGHLPRTATGKVDRRKHRFIGIESFGNKYCNQAEGDLTSLSEPGIRLYQPWGKLLRAWWTFHHREQDGEHGEVSWYRAQGL
ncbi:Enniatin synthase, partial [Fusarium oligoseptatum]